MRRNDRELSQTEALLLLEKGEYGILSTVSKSDMPYGVPLSYCILKNHLYFHCAVEGRKLDNLDQNSAVSFCIVGGTEVMPGKFGTKYESVIVSGIASEVFEKTKRRALEGLLQKYSSSHMEAGCEYIDKLTDQTRVFAIEIEKLSGKARKK